VLGKSKLNRSRKYVEKEQETSCIPVSFRVTNVTFLTKRLKIEFYRVLNAFKTLLE
jgi:hypothetical protein